jgi:Mg2+ and Co2+ transporter CorA
MMLYRLIHDIAEQYLDLVDSLDAEIDELEATVETSPPTLMRGRLSELRPDLLHIRRTLAPTRDAGRPRDHFSEVGWQWGRRGRGA